MSPDMENITTAQLRAARALLRWSAEDLATAAGVSLVTIRRAEPKDGMLAMIPANAAAVRRALEEAGVIFIAENGEGAGVRLRKVKANLG
jgi:transcriptional regulator with XRE-family HTH domain